MLALLTKMQKEGKDYGNSYRIISFRINDDLCSNVKLLDLTMAFDTIYNTVIVCNVILLSNTLL